MNTLRLALLLALLFPVLGAQAQAPLHELLPPGAEAGSRFGTAVAGVSDVNGNGLGDVLVGDARGRVYLYDGGSGALLQELVSPRPQPDGRFGAAVAGVPDADGDGVDDLLVGAYEEDERPWSGHAYLFSGATGALLHELASPNGDRPAEGYFGFSVAGVSDTDGDGRGDLLVGAKQEPVLLADGTTRSAGRAYLFSGATGDLLHEWVSPNAAVGGEFGASVSGVADADGDGRGDLLVGARQENPGSVSYGVGRAYLFSGATGALLHTLVSPGEERYAYFGGSVSGVPDANGDGRGDLLIGAEREEPDASPKDAGRAYLFSGSDGSLLLALASPLEEASGAFGRSVAGVPDADGDGRGDLLIGASGERTSGSLPPVGRAYLFSGADGSPLGSVVSPADHSFGPFYASGFAGSVAGVPDVDGDGRGDLLVGATGEASTGRAYLFDSTARLPAVALSLVAAPPVALVEEGRFSFTAVLHNTTSEVQVAEAWAEIVPEDGGPPADPVFGPVTVTLEPGERAEREVVQAVPDGLAPGAYTYRGYVGAFPANPEDGDSFPGFVTAIAGERFYPLAVGDTWTYRMTRGTCSPSHWECYPEFGGYVRRTVVADTLIAGDMWSVLEVELSSLDGDVLETSRCASRVAPDGRVEGRAVSGACDTFERILQESERERWNLRQPVAPDEVPATVEVGDQSYPVEATRSFHLDIGGRYDEASIETATDLGVVSYYMEFSLFRGGTLEYARVGGVAYGGNPVASEDGTAAPAALALSAAYPNPFGSATALALAVPEAQAVRLAVYDVLGREVAVLLDGEVRAGAQTVRFDGAGLPSGVYLVRLTVGKHVATQRLTLVR